MDEVPLGAANDRREKFVNTTVHIDHSLASTGTTLPDWPAKSTRHEIFGER